MKENFNENNNEPKPHPLIARNIDNEGNPLYGVTGPLPKLYPGIPSEVFDQIKADLDSLPDNNESLKFHQGEMLELSINSDKKVRYEICDAKNGHYFIAKVDHEAGKIKGEFFLSHEKKEGENPDLIVCSAEELEGYLKG